MVWGVERDGAAAERREPSPGSRRRARLAPSSRRSLAAGAGGPAPSQSRPPAPIRYRGDDHRAGELDPVHPRACRRRATARSSCSARRCRASSRATATPPAKVAAAHASAARGPRPHAGQPYFVHEEEVPRAGTRAAQLLPADALDGRPRRTSGSASAGRRAAAKARAGSASTSSTCRSRRPVDRASPARQAAAGDARPSLRLRRNEPKLLQDGEAVLLYTLIQMVSLT